MSRWVTKPYPWLLAFVPILTYAANNPGQYGFGDLALTLGIAAALCALVYALASVAAGRKASPGLPALATLLAVFW